MEPRPANAEETCPDLSLELVERIQGGDRAAWDQLYLRYRDALLFAIRCRLGGKLRSHLGSEDILHSVVRDALGELSHFEPRGPGSLKHYLHVCVLNKIRSKAEYYGAAKRAGAEALSDSVLATIPREGSTEPGYIDAERYERLERGLAQLSEEFREVVLLRTIEGLANKEAAAVLGKSPEATSKLYNRAVARLATLAGAR